jgi:ABC-2 type transport system permease protein
MRSLSKYAAFARIAAVHAASARGELYGRMVFFAVILGVFSSLWQAVAEAGMPMVAEASTLVWYLAATEWILLSPPAIHVDIEGEVRRGDVAYQLVRPFSYLMSVAAQGLGSLLVRAPLLALTAFGCAFAFTGRVPDARAFVYLMPFGLFAMVLVHGLYVLTGLTAFWLGDVSPVFWIGQKLLFILGGLMLPLALYPEWMQQVSRFTPFPSLLAGPAGFMIGGGAPEAWTLAMSLCVWGLTIALTALLMFRRAVRTLQVNGG